MYFPSFNSSLTSKEKRQLPKNAIFLWAAVSLFLKDKTKFDVNVEQKIDWISGRKEKNLHGQYPTWWETLMTFSWFESKTSLILEFSFYIV